MILPEACSDDEIVPDGVAGFATLVAGMDSTPSEPFDLSSFAKEEEASGISGLQSFSAGETVYRDTLPGGTASASLPVSSDSSPEAATPVDSGSPRLWEEVLAMRERQLERVAAAVVLQAATLGWCCRRALKEAAADQRLSSGAGARRRRWLSTENTPAAEPFMTPRTVRRGGDLVGFWSKVGIRVVLCWTAWRQEVARTAGRRAGAAGVASDISFGSPSRPPLPPPREVSLLRRRRAMRQLLQVVWPWAGWAAAARRHRVVCGQFARRRAQARAVAALRCWQQLVRDVRRQHAEGRRRELKRATRCELQKLDRLVTGHRAEQTSWATIGLSPAETTTALTASPQRIPDDEAARPVSLVSLADLEPFFEAEAEADAGWLLLADAEPRADVRPPPTPLKQYLNRTSHTAIIGGPK
jgi:hypothetical protein